MVTSAFSWLVIGALAGLLARRPSRIALTWLALTALTIAGSAAFPFVLVSGVGVG